VFLVGCLSLVQSVDGFGRTGFCVWRNSVCSPKVMCLPNKPNHFHTTKGEEELRVCGIGSTVSTSLGYQDTLWRDD
jgi:hypothetical protein